MLDLKYTLRNEMKKKYLLLVVSFLLFTANSVFSGENGYKYVFIDGTFDLAHYGHQQVIQNAINTGMDFFHLPKNKIKVVVGISGSDEELTVYKRKPVYSIEEKMRQVRGFKGVYKVVNSPMVTTKKFIQTNKIDLVVAGGDYADPIKAKKYYSAAIELGIFKTFPRTEGVSTTRIMKNVIDSVADTILKRLDPNDPNYESDKLAVKRFVELQEEHF